SSRGNTTGRRSSRHTVDPLAWWCRTSTSGRARSGFVACSFARTTSQDSGNRSATTTAATPGAKSATPATEGLKTDGRAPRLADRDRHRHPLRDCGGQLLHPPAAELAGASRRAALRRAPDGGRRVPGSALVFHRLATLAHR